MTNRVQNAGYTVSGEARQRIVEAGIRCIVRHGVTGASMSVIAAECNVSKALLHYHFVGREQLLCDVVMALGHRLIARERSVFDHGEAAGSVDQLWQWFETELRLGELRALLALGTVCEEAVRRALKETSTARRSAASRTVDRLFVRLRLVPRVPAALIADASVAFIDGLVLEREFSARDPRVSFDVFWLAMLSLGD